MRHLVLLLTLATSVFAAPFSARFEEIKRTAKPEELYALPLRAAEGRRPAQPPWRRRPLRVVVRRRDRPGAQRRRYFLTREPSSRPDSTPVRP
ncbi:MAG: hypothetical protein WDM96_06150 [Lacunisphaera sp.]